MATEAERYFVEKVSLYFEQLGFPRMGGRIFAWLLISETPQASMAELMEALQASKSSISSMTRLLIQVELIEVISVPGERRDYFRIRSDAWTTALKDRLAQAFTFRQLADEGLVLLKDSSPQRKQRLQEMRLMYAFLEREIPILVERWEKERQSLYKSLESS
ncbi:MAG: MarR family transcriptional regulator [Chloroflexota bacterium]|nr:MAG: MarR family transcriptional regulator [Chloroflexota bacterium]